MAGGSRRKYKIRFRPNAAQVVLFGAAVFLVAYLFLRALPDRTLFLSAETYTYTQEAKLYAFKDEDYAIFNSTNPVDFTYPEGTTLSASSVISPNYTIYTDKYLEQKIAAIDYMIAHPQMDTKWEFYVVASEVNERIVSLKKQLDEAVSAVNEAVNAKDEAAKAEGEARKTELLNALSAAENERMVLKRAMQYVFTPVSDLKVMKAQQEGLRGQLNIPLSYYNLNFSVYGKIYYSIDGYEDDMSIDIIESITDGYFDYLDRLAPGVSKEEGQYCIRSAANDRMVVGVRVSGDTVYAREEDVLDEKDTIVNKYNIDKEGGYYHFIYRRLDILGEFPTMTVEMKDGTLLKGQVVDVLQNAGDKVYMLALRSGIDYMEGKRITDGKLQTQSVNAYVLPSSAVVDMQYAQYVTVITDATEKTPVKVTVFDYVGDNVILKVSDNPALSSGMEILKKGEKPSD